MSLSAPGMRLPPLLWILGPRVPDDPWPQAPLHLLPYLDPERFQLHLACSPGTARDPRLRPGCARIHPLPELGRHHAPWSLAHPTASLRALLRSEPFVLIHSWGRTPSPARFAARQAGVPWVHTYLRLPPAPSPVHPLAALRSQLDQRLRPAITCCLTTSQHARDTAHRRRLLDWMRSRTLCPGVDAVDLQNVPRSEDVRHRLGLPHDQFVVALGSHPRPPTIRLATEAFSGVRPASSNTSLLIPAAPPRSSRARHRLHQLVPTERLHFSPAPDQFQAWLQAADVAVFASPADEPGQNLLLALCRGKAVIAPHINGIAEFVAHGETGLLYEAGKAHQLASHLSYLLAHPPERYRLGVNARRLARARFNARRSARQLEATYAELLPAPTAR